MYAVYDGASNIILFDLNVNIDDLKTWFLVILMLSPKPKIIPLEVLPYGILNLVLSFPDLLLLIEHRQNQYSFWL